MTVEEVAKPERRRGLIWWLGLPVSLALLLSCLSSQVEPVRCWPLALFGMLFPWLVVADAAVLLFHGVVRRRLHVLCALAMACAVPHLGEYAQLSGRLSQPAGVSNSFSVMSWNVRLFDLYNWTHNQQTRDEMMDLIRVEDPDILCMQEFLDVDGGDQLEVKDTLLSAYRYTACADAYTVHTRGNQHIGIAIFSTWPVLAQGTIHFPDELNNLALWADIALGRDTIRVYTAHLASLRFGDQDYDFIRNVEQGGGADSLGTAGTRILGRLRDAFIRRGREATTIAEHMKNSPWPVVYCGDLNDSPMGYSYHELLRSGLIDAFSESGEGLGHTYIGNVPSFRIDHIMHGPQFNAWGFRTLPDELSDHRAIITSMGLKVEE
ncbi:MAG: endonuclease/exonuclease/phosphatase family protein [Flavobacteriales bacterium]|nr:endonuclease/exonuclease/phosphatase family protein [Flavobacteriales bacterium]